MLKCIAAVDQNFGLGKSNDLLFKIRKDMLRFKELTYGKIVVCGWNTLQSFPGGKALPGRTTICLCPDEIDREDCYCVHSFEECLKLVKELAKTQEVWIIGGGMLYKAMYPHCDLIELTRINANGDAEVFFPNIDNDDSYVLVGASAWMLENDIEFRFETYVKCECVYVE